MISPITAVISIFINVVGFYFDFWHYKPEFQKIETISAMPLDVGLFAVLGALLIYTLIRKPFGIHPIVTLLVFSLLNTLMEFVALKFDLVTYSNGWNIGWTFISYFIANLLVITAWRIVRIKIELLSKH
ncbi:CBO0543 family protein [Paenibacillus sp. PAMC21692]|uniref:CBO0543 family protein n=1 Tax=Paenibacillus sp. PAMC21692 TaxID=2762320 RepID=UPI00164D5539|nr:CBO0543 family protein [Paenibacillus sp. PAMC21692]QNK54709.1 hypothetical protein H7F31_18875 [Paenibacillus sp. PAMC21692]